MIEELCGILTICPQLNVQLKIIVCNYLLYTLNLTSKLLHNTTQNASTNIKNPLIHTSFIHIMTLRVCVYSTLVKLIRWLLIPPNNTTRQEPSHKTLK